jgi:Zn-dependent protease
MMVLADYRWQRPSLSSLRIPTIIAGSKSSGRRMSNDLTTNLCVIALVIYGTSLHEMAHAFIAHYFGDPTPGRYNRLTFNPIPHLDPILTAVIFPVIFYLSGGGLFCMAQTPVDPSRFKRPFLHQALMAAGGPAMNFLLAAVMLGILWIPGVWQPYNPNYNMAILTQAAYWNVILGVFNLMPVPPLDGYTIIRGALPLSIRRPLDDFRRMGVMSLMLGVVIGSFLYRTFFDDIVTEIFIKLLPRG